VPTPLSGPECARLTTEQERLKRLYGTTVDRLFAIGYQVTDAEYKKLRDSIEETFVQLQIAGQEIERHNFDVHSKAG